MAVIGQQNARIDNILWRMGGLTKSPG